MPIRESRGGHGAALAVAGDAALALTVALSEDRRMPGGNGLRMGATRAGAPIAVAMVIAAFLVGQRARPVEVRASQASQQVVRDAARKPSLAVLQSKLSRLARNVADLKKQLAANTTADAAFLKSADASAQFLRVDGTAVNAQKVGGIAADGLVQGKGQVQTNAVTIAAAGNESQLLGDGSVRLLVGLSGAGQPYVKLVNGTASPLQLTTIGATSPASSIAASSSVTITPNQAQMNIQVFDGTGRLWTTTLSTAAVAQGEAFVGQMAIGLR